MIALLKLFRAVTASLSSAGRSAVSTASPIALSSRSLRTFTQSWSPNLVALPAAQIDRADAAVTLVAYRDCSATTSATSSPAVT